MNYAKTTEELIYKEILKMSKANERTRANVNTLTWVVVWIPLIISILGIIGALFGAWSLEHILKYTV